MHSIGYLVALFECCVQENEACLEEMPVVALALECVSAEIPEAENAQTFVHILCAANFIKVVAISASNDHATAQVSVG